MHKVEILEYLPLNTSEIMQKSPPAYLHVLYVPRTRSIRVISYVTWQGWAETTILIGEKQLLGRKIQHSPKENHNLCSTSFLQVFSIFALFYMKRTYLTNNNRHRQRQSYRHRHRHHHLSRYDHRQRHRQRYINRHRHHHHLYLYLKFCISTL